MNIVIFGYGKMAEAIVGGLKKSNFVTDIEVVGRNEEKLKSFANRFDINYSLMDGYDISEKNVILAIKPYALQEVSMRIKGKANILISILAGKSLIELQKYISSKSYIRAMPNIAAKFGTSTTAITGDINAKEIAIKIFNSIGESVWVDSDDEIDMATAIIGSAPAFLAIIAEAISDGGVYIGLKREVSVKLTKGLFRSFAAIDSGFSEIKDSVMSPKGTTAEGIRVLEEEGVRGKILKSIIKTYEKAKRI